MRANFSSVSRTAKVDMPARSRKEHVTEPVIIPMNSEKHLRVLSVGGDLHVCLLLNRYALNHVIFQEGSDGE